MDATEARCPVTATSDARNHQKQNELGQAELDRIRKEHLQIAQEQARDDMSVQWIDF